MNKKIMTQDWWSENPKHWQKVFCQDFRELFNYFDLEKSKDFNFIFVTDPPYNQGFKYDIYDDNLGYQEYIDLLSDIPSPRVMIHYPEETINILPHAYKGEFCDEVITWVYNGNLNKHSRSISFWGIKPNYNRVKQPFKNLNDKRIQKLIENGSEGARSYDWFNLPQVKNVSKEKTQHPCQIPIKVFERIIKLIVPDNEYEKTVIVDPFCGSGSSGVACKNLGLKYLGFEISNNYWEIARNNLGVGLY